MIRNQSGIFVLYSFLLLSMNVFSQDPNFHIYLCFGQSNMEGQGTIETQDRTVDPRFQVMEAVACSNLGRTKGSWYTAVPPLTRCYSGLSPADYFGRTMVENLPDSIKVGIINVSVAGCKIELFQKNAYQTYVSSITESWLKNIINEYTGNPYAYLIDLAKQAQKDGIIKGILLHQGESNTGDSQWPAKVKSIYDDLMVDLNLNPTKVPLLAGEVVHADQGGVCASMNSIIAKLPQSVSNSYVISSSKCTDAADNLHFNSAGYREIGRRYGVKMLSLMGIEAAEPENPEEPENPTDTEAVYLEPECAASIGENWDIIADTDASDGSYIMVKAGIQSLAEAAGSEGSVELSFSVETAGNFNIYARLNCPSADDDSYWIKMDDGAFVMVNGLATSAWQWMNLNNYDLTAGAHTLTITYREDGAKLDKICISNYTDSPQGMGNDAENACSSTNGTDRIESSDGYALGQIYPNPISDKANISFEIPGNTYVSLKVYNLLGVEIAELAGKEFAKGKHTIKFDAKNLSSGVYFYTIKADKFSASKKMILQGN